MFVCILPEKAVPEMTNTVLGGALNPTHSLTFQKLRVTNTLIIGGASACFPLHFIAFYPSPHTSCTYVCTNVMQQMRVHVHMSCRVEKKSWFQALACVCVCVYLQFQLNPGVLPFFPSSQFLPKDTGQCNMLQPLAERFRPATDDDETLTDWHPLDYGSNPLWASPQGPRSPMCETDSDVGFGSPAMTQTWSTITDSQHGAPLDESEQLTTSHVSEQVVQ